MGLVSVFKSFAHAIAAGSKYFATKLVPEAVKVASKAQELQPEADILLTLLAGPHAAAINDLACNVLGEVANVLVPLSQDQAAAVQSSGINLKLDAQVVADVKQFSALIQQILAARGTPAPAPAAK